MLGWTEYVRASQLSKWKPECCGNFAVGRKSERFGNREHERANQDRWEYWTAGGQVVELAETIRRIERYPDLFQGLADGSEREVGIAG